MASNNSINFDVNFKTNDSLQKIKSEVEAIKKLTAEGLFFAKGGEINPANGGLDKVKTELQTAQKAAEMLETAMRNSFNPKINTTDIQKFKSELSGLNLQQLHKDLSGAGAAGQTAFRNITTQALTANLQIKQTSKLLEGAFNTLKNSIKYNLATNLFTGFTGKINETYGYIKALDSSLNSIRIVTGNSADEMSRFAVQANDAAKALGQTTTNYTDAALIYAQQGLGDADIAERTASRRYAC